ncbi:OmpA family protein [Hydrogenovibrio sp. 3SP14C1]|uniref:OmpA/MotB family protein n=1 Tax=Hydrogenovibrio sp. 3SP14C1 TaxID=3038774 RepID=UPI00241707BD|nr:OmpA family protein [Hydrogenovibrio sp. 3SP14C1]MDG4812055.1 OmpA family protein [Hydrogenovibrio sp. 3SP14C1]
MKAEAIIQAEDQKAVQRIKRNQSWQVVYIALFTSLLAFFVLITTLIELEGSQPKRDYQKLVNFLYLDALETQKRLGMSWLQIENTLSKGIKITMQEEVFSSQDLFASGRAKVNPRYLPYINRFVGFLTQLQLEKFQNHHPTLVRSIVKSGETFQVTIRIEGHTDASPLAKTALYKSNFELSTFRAYAIMNLLQIYSGLPESLFSIAGYGSFHPLTSDPYDSKNRRVEIYLIPQVIQNGSQS